MKKIILPIAAMFIVAGCNTTNTSGIINDPMTTQILGSILSGQTSTPGAALNTSTIAAGLREALNVGTGTVVGQLGKTNGFNADPKIHIPLPGALGRVQNTLSALGMGGLTDDLELRLNRAAEAATPKAKTLFVSAIKDMTINDARAILTGPSDSATTYLRGAMGDDLLAEIQPLIQTALNNAGAIRAYDQVMGQYAALPFMPNVKTDLQDYVGQKTLDGIFYYVAQEEAAIRANPAKRTTQLLQTVFGG